MSPLLLSLAALAGDSSPSLSLVVHPVAETCLIGPADGEYWQAALAAEGLKPDLVEGRATVPVCATHARFGGRDFGEGTVGVATQDGGQLLVAAINDVRFYAWVERKRNRSPYGHGDVSRTRQTLRLSTHDGLALEATLGPASAAPQPWVFEGPIYLPAMGDEPGGVFTAKLSGSGEVLPFDPTRDRLTLGSSCLAATLVASGWQPVEWRRRDEATHAKSDTVSRPASREWLLHEGRERVD